MPASCAQTERYFVSAGSRCTGSIHNTDFGFFNRLNVEVDRNGFAIAAHQNAFEHLVAAGVDLLMRHIGRDENEIAGIGFRGELQVIAPTHPRPSLHDINNALKVTVVMRAGLGVRLDGDGARPEFLRPRAREIYRGLSIHPGRRGHIGIELIAWNDANAIVLPALAVLLVIRVIGVAGVFVRACHLLLSKNVRTQSVAKIALCDQNQRGTFALSGTCLCEGLQQREKFNG